MTTYSSCTRETRRILSVGSLLLLGIGVLHRSTLFLVHAVELEQLVSANADWLSWQYLTIDAFSEHFWNSIWYLQQQPPLPNMLFGAMLHVFAWPLGVAPNGWRDRRGDLIDVAHATG